MTVLSNHEMRMARREGSVVIEPFEESHVATSSYDVRLGEFFYREQHPPLDGALFNPLDPEHVARVWGRPERAQPAISELWSENYLPTGIGEQDHVILLEPGETILGHTEEFIGGRAWNGSGVTTMMKARSSLGRSFILVCKCAGWGDVGYINRWTMEITNVSRHYRIPLVVGSRIAQIVFFRTGAVSGRDYGHGGAYQHGDDLAALKAKWSPADMLPKLRR